jgi:Tfp pilus assembly protein PilX
VATQKKPTDFTGRQRDAQVAQQLEDQAARQNEVALAQAEAAIKAETEVIDATKPMKAEPVILDTVTKSDDSKATVTIRVSENIESMTYGAGNYYSFKAGQKYEVTPDVAAHLEEKGYVSARY